MPQLVIDIETVGEDFDSFDETTKEYLTRDIQADVGSEAYETALGEIRRTLVFSPLTGQIIAIGLLDVEHSKSVVYFQAPGEDIGEFQDKGVKYKQMTEDQMLNSFWGGVMQYSEFITFNGRSFDIPYIITRSAVHSIPITKDLMSNRFTNNQKFGAKHIDLKDQLSFYGAVRKPGSLHMWCRALGIQSPKEEGVAGDDVERLFKGRKFIDIARYNARDLEATKELYLHWERYFMLQ